MLECLWAKTSVGTTRFHPLILHLIDVGTCAEAVLSREPDATRQRIGEVLGLRWEIARPWLLLLISSHDLGKACPGFQYKWQQADALLRQTTLSRPTSPNTKINHAYVSQLALAAILKEHGWPENLADLASDAVGCHHGSRSSPTTIERLEVDERALGRSDWSEARRSIFGALMDVFRPRSVPAKNTLSGPDFMLLSGLTSFVDWIGSNEEWFPFGRQEDCNDLRAWFEKRRVCANRALDSISWGFRTPLSDRDLDFEEAFPACRPIRPLQKAVAEAVRGVAEPSILLLEAPMGEGKTEAAFYAHMQLQRRLDHRGMYIALPTKATGNAMFERTLRFLRSQNLERHLDLQLLHGGALMTEAFRELAISGIYDPEGPGDVRAGEWFTQKKRALLSEYGVGTVDQALLPILPVRHQFVRMWGLANRTVIFDEIHAYDAYTGTLLLHLVRWLLALNSTVILLSATLPPSIRRRLMAIAGSTQEVEEVAYPRLSVFRRSGVDQIHFEADPSRRLSVQLEGIAPDLPVLAAALAGRLEAGGLGLALVNTVQRAQELYQLFPVGRPILRNNRQVGKQMPDGTRVYLFHARFPAADRQSREEAALEIFGRSGTREGRAVLIATQVAEQSLDLDFDCIATDLAPIDLLLQRAGRLWRHARQNRPTQSPILLVAGLEDDAPPAFGEPLWWGAVYREDVLLRTWALLKTRSNLRLPDEIDGLVQFVYEEVQGVPGFLQDRLDRAVEFEEGRSSAFRSLANQAIIGFPEDASWNDPARYLTADEDEPGLHPTLVAQTRLGELSIVVVPLFPGGGYRPELVPSESASTAWCSRAMSISRKGVVGLLRSKGVPTGWSACPRLRNCYPLLLDEGGRWKEDATVRLDDELGLVYGRGDGR
jgi:CRISPR-associated endonuclease/helicase Cas3